MNSDKAVNKTKKASNQATFEQQIARLEWIVAALEKRDVPLADSLALFQEGTRLIAACSQKLDQAEQQVVRLMKGPEPDYIPIELPFASESEIKPETGGSES